MVALAMLLPSAALPASSAEPDQPPLATTPRAADFQGDDFLIQAYQYWRAQQYDEVLALVSPLAMQGNPKAQFLMGGIYSKGEGVPQDDEHAVEWWRKAAEQGLDRAQNELGVALFEGRGVEAEPVQAVMWFRKAAEAGLAVAQTNLGLAYWEGRGVLKDEREAVTWFHKGADHGVGWAQFYLGNAYSAGRGVARDQVEAVRWWRQAAEQDYTDAQYSLGMMYLQGQGIGKDRTRGAYWLARAASRGHELAENRLKRVLVELPGMRMRSVTEVRAKPDPEAAVIKTARVREYASELGRANDWVEVYFENGRVLGYINVTQLGGK